MGGGGVGYLISYLSLFWLGVNATKENPYNSLPFNYPQSKEGDQIGERENMVEVEEAQSSTAEEEPAKKSKWGATAVLVLLVVGICWSLGQSSAALIEAS